MLNGFALGSAGINSSSVAAQYIYLPSSTMTWGLELAERRFVSLSGLIDAGMSLAGDISKIANLGAANLYWSFDHIGALSKISNLGSITDTWTLTPSGVLSAQLSLGAQDISMSFDLSGVLKTVVLLPSGQSDWVANFEGSITRAGGLVGSIDMETEIVGDPTRVRFFGDQLIDTNYSFTGLLTRTQYMVGSIDSVVDFSGDLSRGLVIPIGSGSMGWNTGLTGNLSGILRMSASIDVQLDLVGNLSRGSRAYFEDVAINANVDFSGNLSGIYHMSGDIGVSMDLTGDLARRVLFGLSTLDMSFSFDGALSNNVFNTATDKNTMVRPYQERTMVR